VITNHAPALRSILAAALLLARAAGIGPLDTALFFSGGIMRSYVLPTLASVVAGALLTGCPDRTLSEVDPIPENVEKKSIPVKLNRNIDILFVVDDSGSMIEEQTSLRNNFPAFINVLNTIEGGLPDVHLGVISTNAGTGGVNIGGCSTATAPNGDDGNLQTNSCAGLQAAYIEDLKNADGTRARNYSGDLTSLFSCMANLGTAGCGFEAHLNSVKLSLSPGKNPGFLRPNAYLAVIFITDEDDCSTKPGGAMFGDPNGTVASPLARAPRSAAGSSASSATTTRTPAPSAPAPAAVRAPTRSTWKTSSRTSTS
jgi:hypothetical protein